MIALMAQLEGNSLQGMLFRRKKVLVLLSRVNIHAKKGGNHYTLVLVSNKITH